MTSFFRGLSQTTPFQQAVEKVTDGNQPTEDWGLIMRVCDHVSDEDRCSLFFSSNFSLENSLDYFSAKEAMKVVRKRLQANPLPSGWNSIQYTLTVNGICLRGKSNSSRRFVF